MQYLLSIHIEMYTVVVWILLISRAVALTRSNACDILDLVEIGSCQQVFGPPINCSGQVLGHVSVIKELYENLTIHDNLYSRNMRFKRMKLAYKMLKKLLKEADSFRDYLKLSHMQHQNSSVEDCVNIHLFEHRMEEIGEYVTLFTSFKRWIDFYFPAVAGLEFAFGMYGNFMVVLIFIRNEDMRTDCNKLILNLAVGDIFLLVTNTVIYYVRYRWLPMKVSPRVCKVMSYTRTVAVASSVYSMVILSMLRFLATASTPGGKTQRFMDNFLKIPVLLTLVWILAAVVGIPELFDATIFCELSTHALTKYFKFTCLCLLPLAAIGVFTVLTSRILQRSVEQFPGEQIPNMLRQKQARERSARVLLCLLLVFCVTYLPLNIYSLRKEGFEIADYRSRFILQLLIPLNSCLNPAALCVGCSKFREIFKKYHTFNCSFEVANFGREQKSDELREGRFTTSSESSKY